MSEIIGQVCTAPQGISAVQRPIAWGSASLVPPTNQCTYLNLIALVAFKGGAGNGFCVRALWRADASKLLLELSRTLP